MRIRGRFSRNRRFSLQRAIVEGLEPRQLLSVDLLGGLNSLSLQGPSADQASTENSPTVTPLASTAPTVANPASANPSTVTGTSTALSVLGADSEGESTLTYTWVTTGAPPVAVGFSANGTNAAKNTTATFSAAGSYSFQVTITNAEQLSVTSNVNVQVNQTATSVSVVPASATVAATATNQFSATELDQFGIAMATQPAFDWSVTSGAGSVNASGIYTAAATAGSATVQASVAGGPAAHAVITAVSTLAWYQMNASSGTTLTDSSGNGKTATLTGATAFTTGVSGNALSLTGGYASLPTGIVSTLNDFTISAWVKVTTLAGWSRVFDFGTGTTDYMFLTPDSGDTGVIRFAISTGGPGNPEQQLNGPPIALNTWTQITVTLAGNTGTLYVDGVAAASNSNMTDHPINLGNTPQNYLGKSQFGSDPALTGMIDDFRIYGAALSAQQVQQLANPSIAAPAAASASPVTTTSTTLSVLGSDLTAGESGLTYTWATTGTPPAAVVFSANGTNASKNVTATFTQAGTYNFTVSIVNPNAGFTTTSSAAVTVNQTLTTITITPSGLALGLNTTQQFAASAADQFGTTLSTQPPFTFSLGSGSVGSITGAGLYSSLGTAGSATVVATSGLVSGNASVTVSSSAPSISTPASASPNPVTGTTANLSVAAIGGTGTLTYTWATTGSPPAAVAFLPNGTNAAKNSVASFTNAGTYNLQVMVTDTKGLKVFSTVTVTVNSTATSVSVTSATNTVIAGNTTQLSATELDQFGAAMQSQPAFIWSVNSGRGSVSTSGLYTAAPTGGSATIHASVSGGPTGSITISVVAPIVWYQADQSSGTTLTDSSGNNQNATLTGSTSFGPGVINNAVSFSGGYASAPTGIVSTLSDFTITAWVKLTALANWARIFDFGTGTNDYMFLTGDAGGTNALRFAITTSGNGHEQQLNGPAMSVGVWTHIAITLAGSSATLYVNGNSVATNTSMTLHPSSLGSTNQNYLGKSQFSGDPTLNGSIDDFRIYGSALSAQQVQQLAMLALPTGWTDMDIGSPANAGSAFFIPSTGIWTVNGGGADINGTSDQFNFASTTLSGDVVLTAEVTSVDDTNTLSKAGLMIRSSTAAGSIEASLLETPDSGVYFETRSASGQITVSAQWTGLSGPVWLQLDRYGSNVFGYLSNDDVHWYAVGGEVTLPLGNQVLAGLAVTSHNNTVLSGSTFSNVSVAANATPTIATAASAAPATFTGYSTNLSVLGADDAGEENLTYTWATTGTPPAPVSFSTNASNAAKNTQATFTASGTYTLTVTISDAGGLSTQSSIVVTVSVPPAPPVGVSALWTGSTVTVSWQAAAGVVSYNIYRATTVGGEGSLIFASGITATSFVDTNVTLGVTYYYQVTAVGTGGLESARSFEVAAMVTPFTTPIISEFMASNSVTLADSAGDFPDWLELYNPTANTVTLTGDYLTDDTKTLNEWQIPSSTLAPGAFLIVFADSESDTDSTGAFHTNFNIGASGGYLALVASNGSTVLSSYTYTQQVSDVAYGVGMAQTGALISYGGVGFLKPTPGALNGPVIATAIAAEPTFNYPDGFYNTSLQLTISSATAGASIYYTLDGTAPSPTNGTLYTGPITVSGETNISAMAVAAGNLPSATAVSSYIYLSQVLTQASNGQAPAGWPVDWGYSLVHYGMDPTVVDDPSYSSEITQDLLDLPSVSLTMNLQDLFDPVTGIYSESQLSNGWERAGSIELINPNGPAGFQADVGVSLKGDYSALLQNGKHGFDIHFSSQYGISELDYPLFGPNAAQSFNEILLRTDQNNSWSYSDPQSFIGIRDEFSSALLAAAGQPAEHYQICFLYINGMFWGLYDIIEKPNADFAANYFGGSDSDYDDLKATNLTATNGGIFGVEAESGTLTAWDQLFTDVSTLDMSNNTYYEMIQGNNADGSKNPNDPNLLDVNNLIDYMLVIYYTGNYDAPYSTFINGPNNFYAIRPIDGSTGFQFIATDSEWSLLNVNQNSVNLEPNVASLTSATSAGPAYLFQMLENNADFKVAVGDQVEKLFFNGGPMSVTAATNLFNTLAAEVQGPVVGESARWGDATRPGQAYTRDTDWQPLINSMLSSYFPQRTGVVVAQLEAVGLYPATPPPPTFNQYGGTIPSGFQLTMTGGPTIYYTLNGSDPQNSDGSLSSTAIAYSGAISLFATTEVKARVQLSNGSWSALVDETFVTAASSVRITELNYDPAKPPSGSSYNNDDFEFVELENFSSQSVNLSGVAFTDGIAYTFGNVTLGPWQVGVLVHNTLAFQSRYGTSINIIGDYDSTGDSFNNSGEDVELVDATGNVLDHFDYTPCIAAYPTAHGKGSSLEALDPDGPENLNLASSWYASTVTNGTPGQVPLLLGSTPAYLQLDADGQHIDMWNAANDSGNMAESLPIAEVYAITFAAAAATDSLTIDFSNGNPLSAAPLTFSGGSTPSALTIIGSTNADTLAVTASTATFTGTFGSTSFSYSNASNITFIGNGGADTLTQSAQPGGGATLSFSPGSANTLNVNTGTYTIPAPLAGSGFNAYPLATLNIANGANVKLQTATSPSDRTILALGALSIGSTAQLDLGGNDMIVHSATNGESVAMTIFGQVGTARGNGGAWTGSGITSSAAAASPDTTALAVVLNDQNQTGMLSGNPLVGSTGFNHGLTTFDGQTVADGDVLVKYTYYGDALLNGNVTAADYAQIDNGFNSLSGSAPLKGWLNGDFNYDGAINGDDYTLIDNAFNSQGSVSFAASPANVIANNTAPIADASQASTIAVSRTAKVRPVAAAVANPFTDESAANQELKKRRRNRVFQLAREFP